jgi:hypothetical protein
MMLSDFYESTIEDVRVDFGFSDFACHPDEITRTLELQPVEFKQKGDIRRLRGTHEITASVSIWSISSTSTSKDVNVHLRELLEQLQDKAQVIRSEWGRPMFSVIWKGNYLYAGSGPFYEPDVIQGIANLGAELWQDIYQIDGE